MFKKKLYKFLSIFATLALLFNSYFPAIVLAVDDATPSAEITGAPVSGAIWTTDVNCGSVNLNDYASKSDVYLNGGPTGGGGGLPDGEYYVQVTQPNGFVLGTSGATTVTVLNGSFINCYDLFALTSFGDSVNGVYKVWASMNPGFPNSESKTDNFSVRSDDPEPSPPPDIPYYNGLNVCPEGTVKGDQTVASHTISSQDPVGVTFPLSINGQYLFEARGTFVPTGAAGYLSDAGYTLINGEVSPLYGINAPPPGYGAHALLGDLGSGVGIVNWGTYNPGHVYTKYYEPTIGDVQFVIGDRYGTWFNTPWDEQVGMSDNVGSLNLNVYECVPERGTIIVYKETVPQDDGQTPFGVTLFDEAGNPIGTEEALTTGSPVTYYVESGIYYVNETSKPDGWDKDDSDCQGIEVGRGETEGCTIINTKRGTIQGTKYYDEDADGDHDYNQQLFTPYEDQLLNGWTIRLYDKDWQLKATTVTSNLGNEGQYRFHASPGKYFVCEVVQDGWTQSGPLLGASTVDNNHNSTPNGLAVNDQSGAGDEGPICWEINLEPGEKDGWLKFGNYQLGSIFGYKWEDGDGNPATHADKDPVLNWVMELWERINGGW